MVADGGGGEDGGGGGGGVDGSGKRVFRNCTSSLRSLRRR